jgi:hypothetical protein
MKRRFSNEPDFAGNAGSTGRVPRAGSEPSTFCMASKICDRLESGKALEIAHICTSGPAVGFRRVRQIPRITSVLGTERGPAVWLSIRPPEPAGIEPSVARVVVLEKDMAATQDISDRVGDGFG